MVFNSYTFVLFLAVVVGLHHAPVSWRIKKANLLGASYLFYAAWNPPFVVLLWISTLVDWHAARGIAHAERKAARVGFLLLSLGCNLGLLAFFKFGDFLLQNTCAVLRLVGIEFEPADADIVLPVGISFYTFQTLSYTLDVYLRRARPWHSFLDYALYVTFFPQLVAGPIVRASRFLPQCVTVRCATRAQFGWGLSLLVIGLFEKIVVSDGLLAPVADQLYTSHYQPGATAAWYGTLAFAGQIFCDFAGYSSCAIGVAMCLGFSLPDNFRFPYAAVGFSDFWRRWHVSLSTWLRDYLYIPLGGNRSGPTRTHVNLMLTMLIGGLWHGAAWTFVAWGGLHGAFLVLERVLRAAVPSRPLWSSPLGQLALGLATFGAVCFTWVFFRAQSFEQAWAIVTAMAGFGAPAEMGLPSESILTTRVVMLVMLVVHWGMRDRSLEAVAGCCPWLVRAVLLGLMLIAIVHMPGEERAFLYFQF